MQGKRLDWNRAKAWIEKEKADGLVRVSAGLSGDNGSWTTVWERGQYIRPQFPSNRGIFASVHDDPSLVFVFSTSRTEQRTCFQPVDDLTLEAFHVPDFWDGEEPRVTDKEAFYREHVSPLVREIAKQCEIGGIPFCTTFHLGRTADNLPLYCNTFILPLGSPSQMHLIKYVSSNEAPPHLLALVRMIH